MVPQMRAGASGAGRLLRAHLRPLGLRAIYDDMLDRLARVVGGRAGTRLTGSDTAA